MSSLPDSLRQKIREEQPNRGSWTSELSVLLDPKIEARPLTLPGVGQIKPKDETVAFYWVRLKRGNNPDYTRYQQMKAAGYSNATLEDCDPLVNAVNVSNDGAEITCGVDLILMKAPKALHYGALKFHHMRAIEMTNPKSRTAQDAMMRSAMAMNPEERRALEITNTRDASLSEQEQSGRESLSQPQWDKIKKDAEKKGAR